MKQQSRHRHLAAAATTALAATACAAGFAPAASASTRWLCFPGAKSNPCETSLSTTRVSPSGIVRGTPKVRRDRHRRLDCFYVYPTVSDQSTLVSDRRIDPEQRSIARFQAARFSQTCRVFAPMYRQITLAGLLHATDLTASMRKLGYDDVRAAWRTYLARYNHGRGVVLIGHSQGTFVLRQLVARDIDPKAAARRRLVSALLLGGNVLVRRGSDVGGDFKHVRACRSRTQIGCVVAFSTFNATPPANAIFGRTKLQNREVLCTNPAALSGGSARLDTIFPARRFAPQTIMGLLTARIGLPTPHVNTTWIEARGAYSGRCSSAGGANVLRITPAAGAPVLATLPDASWGLHLADANIALGDLVELVRGQGARFAAARR